MIAKDCGSLQPEEHAGLRTAKCDHPSIFGMLLLTYHVTVTNDILVGHTESFLGILHIVVEWVMEL